MSTCRPSGANIGRPDFAAELVEIEQRFERSGAVGLRLRTAAIAGDRSHSDTRLSSDEVSTAVLPSGEKPTELNGLPGDFTAASCAASASRHSRAMPSSQVVSASVPSAERSSDDTHSGCFSTSCAMLFAGGQVPLAAGVVAAGGDEPLAVGREAQRGDRAVVADRARVRTSSASALAAVLPPQPHVAAIVAAGQPLAVRRERERRDLRVVAAQRADGFARCAAFHNLTSVPGLPVAIQLPSGETASVPMRPVGVSTACLRAGRQSQMRTELSPAPVARRLPSGKNTAPETRTRALPGTAAAARRWRRPTGWPCGRGWR